jgi:predicted dehydrogenase
MNDNKRTELIRSGWEIHRAVEESYLDHPAVNRETHPDEWRERQRFLLADMAIHLLQTSLQPGAIDLEKLKNNVHAILTISDAFLPHAELKQATGKIYSAP